MKTLYRSIPGILAMLLLISMTFVLADNASSASSPTPTCNSCNEYSIHLSQVERLNDTDAKWTYEVMTTGEKDISHVTVEVGSCYEIVECGPSPYEYGPDPTTGITGVKWEDSFSGSGIYTLWFTTHVQNIRRGNGEAAIKAGRDVCYYSVEAPVCPPNNVSLKKFEVERITIWDRAVAFLYAALGF